MWVSYPKTIFRELRSYQLSKKYGAEQRKFRGRQAPSTPQAAGHHIYFGPTPIPSPIFYAFITQVVVIFKYE